MIILRKVPALHWDIIHFFIGKDRIEYATA